MHLLPRFVHSSDFLELNMAGTPQESHFHTIVRAWWWWIHHKNSCSAIAIACLDQAYTHSHLHFASHQGSAIALMLDSNKVVSGRKRHKTTERLFIHEPKPNIHAHTEEEKETVQQILLQLNKKERRKRMHLPYQEVPLSTTESNNLLSI